MLITKEALKIPPNINLGVEPYPRCSSVSAVHSEESRPLDKIKTRHLDMSQCLEYIPAMSGLTLEEMSARTGVEPRTLRSWVAEGLLSPPLKSGRGAQYPDHNADRALAVRVLKDTHGFSLGEIRQRFMLASEDDIRSWASEAGGTLAKKSSVRQYLAKIRREATLSEPPIAGRLSPKADEDGFSFFCEGDGGQLSAVSPAAIERLIFLLGRLQKVPPARRTKGESWLRLTVTPDLEFNVRGDLTPTERALFEQLADQIRDILQGRDL